MYFGGLSVSREVFGINGDGPYASVLSNSIYTFIPFVVVMVAYISLR